MVRSRRTRSQREGGSDVYSCAEFCVTALMCDPDAGGISQQECVDGCIAQYDLVNSSEECRLAIVEVNLCIAALDCEIFNDTRSDECVAEALEANTICQ